MTPIVVDSQTLDKVEQTKNKIGEVDVVYCSPLKRARETADLIFGKGNYKVLDFYKNTEHQRRSLASQES